jgi:hypothetical protein
VQPQNGRLSGYTAWENQLRALGITEIEQLRRFDNPKARIGLGIEQGRNNLGKASENSVKFRQITE